MRRQWFFLWLVVWQAVLFGAERVGEVIAVQGKVKAQEAKHALRSLSRGSAVYLGDTIYVAANSRAQIRMSDQTILTLIPATEYTITSYSFRNQTGHFYSNLFKGGLRMISGSIAKSNPQNVAVSTPTATIGLRGTIFAVRVTCSGTYVSCESGTLEVMNGVGSIQLSPSSTQYSLAPVGNQSAPEALSSQPEAMSFGTFAPPSGGGCS